MLTTPQMSLIMFKTHLMEVYISFLMSSIRSMPFLLGIHLLQGLATLLNHHSGVILNNQDPISPTKEMMALCTCHSKFSKLLSQDAMKALNAYSTEAINRFHQRKVHNTKVVESHRMTLLSPLYLIMALLTFLKVT